MRRHRLSTLKAAVTILSIFFLFLIFYKNLPRFLRNLQKQTANYENSPKDENDASARSGILAVEDDQIFFHQIQNPSFGQEDFNVARSNQLSLQRRIPDVRLPSCLSLKYGIFATSVSVVIVFHNEPLSTLLRTVWSVINRTKPEFLLEIILIDDGSQKNFLEKLKLYFSKKISEKKLEIRVIRFEENRGLIKARLAGASSAQGEVLVFLDSHCEVNVGWLEPLLSLIQDDPKTVACPIVDTISAETMDYQSIDGFRATGLFSWSMYFTWGRRPDRETVVGNEWKPFRTATFPGGLFAVDRKWFFEVGSYDEAMEGWGGENLEMSFRVWMCHGSIVFVPCSRVGHLSRDQNFSVQAKTMDRNIVRLAEVWLDEYARFFYMARPDLRGLKVESIAGRKALKSKLQCRNFAWYLDNICPSKTVPEKNVQVWGKIRHIQSGFCVTSTGFDEHEAFPFALQKCANSNSTNFILQLFSLGIDGHLRREEWCIDAGNAFSGRTEIRSYHCDEETSGTWTYLPGSKLRNIVTDKCLEGDAINADVFLANCLPESSQQDWKFDQDM